MTLTGRCWVEKEDRVLRLGLGREVGVDLGAQAAARARVLDTTETERLDMLVS